MTSHRVSVTWREEYKRPVCPQVDTYGIPQAIDARCEPTINSDEETNGYNDTANNPFPGPPPYTCGQALVTPFPPPLADTLEVRLHQEIKHHVDRFRVSIQQLLREQLEPLHGYPTDGYHVVPSDDPPTAAYGLEADDFCQPPVPCAYDKTEPCNLGQNDDGLCIDEIRAGDDLDTANLIERQMDRCLIQLQTLASIVSLALKRTEYL